jgi:hypothetical protein
MATSTFTYNAPGTVSAVFFTKTDSERAYQALLDRGHTTEEISVLMSDETVNQLNRSMEMGDTNDGIVELGRATGTFVGTLMAIPSLVSVPNLGMTISKALLNKLLGENPVQDSLNPQRVIASRIPEMHTASYGDRMNEGGVIISVDPKNREEEQAIVLDFKKYNGHDILCRDGYVAL